MEKGKKKEYLIPVEGSDEEIVADAKMLAVELGRYMMTLKQRGIETSFYTYNGQQSAALECERVTREQL